MNRYTLIVAASLAASVSLLGQDHVADPAPSSPKLFPSPDELHAVAVATGEEPLTSDQLFDAALLRYENLQKNSEVFLGHWHQEARQAYELLQQRLEDPELKLRIRQAAANREQDRRPESSQAEAADSPSAEADSLTHPVSGTVDMDAKAALPSEDLQTSKMTRHEVRRAASPVGPAKLSAVGLREIRDQLQAITVRLDEVIEAKELPE